jgi:succinate dehydrogenase/fumarate reductase flavoprotein subunit
MQDARCLQVKPREHAFKQFKSPILNVLRLQGYFMQVHEVSEQPTAKVPGLFPAGACSVWHSTIGWPLVKVPGLFYPGAGSIWLSMFEQ